MTESDDILATGTATQTQLAKLFQRNRNDMGRLLHGLAPVTTRRNNPVYSIAEAAAMLVKPGYEIEEKLRHMNQADLPPLLGKEFWNGQRARKTFELESGNLWPTDDVIAVFATTFAEVKLALMLMLDGVEREVSLTPRIREIIKRSTTGAIAAMKERLVAVFENHPAPVDNIGEEAL